MQKIKIMFLLPIILLISSIFLTYGVVGKTGFGPAEVFTSNQRETIVIGKVMLLNGNDVPEYGIFSFIQPYSNSETWQVVPSEIIHARVVCNKCGEGMQRWEAILGYIYGAPLHGICTSCNSSDLTFYEVIPRDEFKYLSLEGSQNFDLEKIGDYTWRTIQQISPGGACSVNILYDASESYLLENYKQKWEVHLRGNTQENKESGNFMMGGIDLRILISFKFPLFMDVVSDVKKGEIFTVKIVYGDEKRTWEKIPENTKVTFNGITKDIDQEGTASFFFPDTRDDYEYKIEAKGNYYLSTVKMLKNNNDPVPDDDSFWLWDFLTNIYVIIAIIIIIIICVIIWLILR